MRRKKRGLRFGPALEVSVEATLSGEPDSTRPELKHHPCPNVITGRSFPHNPARDAQRERDRE